MSASPYAAVHLHRHPGVARIGPATVTFAAGDLTLTPAGEVSRYHVDHPGTHLVVHFRQRGRPIPGGEVTLALHHRRQPTTSISIWPSGSTWPIWRPWSASARTTWLDGSGPGSV